MKKYSITTTVNGKALVKQEHTFNTDGCTTSYGDLWSFESCAEAGKWVDRELGIVSNAQRAMDAQKESLRPKSVEQILAESGVKLEPNPLSTASIMANILEKRERLLSNDHIKQDVGVEVDKLQAEEVTDKSKFENIGPFGTNEGDDIVLSREEAAEISKILKQPPSTERTRAIEEFYLSIYRKIDFTKDKDAKNE